MTDAVAAEVCGLGPEPESRGTATHEPSTGAAAAAGEWEVTGAAQEEAPRPVEELGLTAAGARLLLAPFGTEEGEAWAEHESEGEVAVALTGRESLWKLEKY